MSEPPEPVEISYESVPDSEYRNAPLLVRLAGIFSLVAAGIDLLYALGLVGMVIFMGVMFARMPPPGAAGAPGPGGPGFGPGGPPPMAIMYGLYGGYAVASLSVGVVKVIGGIKLLRLGRGAWGWGLAAGIVGCVQLWCSLGCVIPMAAGIYTIVILCLDHVRAYLRARAGSQAG